MRPSSLELRVCSPAETPVGLESLAARSASEQKSIHLLSDNSTAAQYLLSELTSSIDEQKLVAFCRDPNGEIIGACTLTPSTWDSEIYGLKMGKVDWLLAAGDTDHRRETKCELVRAIVREAQERGYRHLSTRVPAVEHDSIHALEGAGFRIMDVQVTLIRHGPQIHQNVLPDGLSICAFKAGDLESLLALSTDAYVESRFFVDPNLPLEKTKLLHRQWVENDCLGRAAAVFVALLDGNPVGYIACLLHPSEMEHGRAGFGDIDLITVSRSTRSRGIATALVRTALVWFAERTDRVAVKTQVTNYPALALYQRAGFLLQQAFETLHLSLPSDCARQK